MQRAQDKIASMQARAGAMDELLASGALTNLTTPVTDIQAELDKAQSGTQIDRELLALKAQIAAAGPAGALSAAGTTAGGAPAGTTAGGAPADVTEAPAQAEVVAPSAPESAPKSAPEGDAATDGGPATIIVSVDAAELDETEPATTDDVATGGTEQ